MTPSLSHAEPIDELLTRMGTPLLNDTVPHHRVLLALSALCTCAFLAWVFWFCRIGLDFRDEGFYFVWMADPFKYDISVTQFGFVYHGLFELLGRDIVAMRRVNLLATFGLAWALANTVLAQVGVLASYRLARYVVAAALACTSLSFLHTWLPTPSYNWLLLQAMLLATMGLLWVAQAPGRGSWLGWLILGFAGWLAFMAKPTSAALLGVLGCAYLAIAGKLRWKPLLLSAGVATSLLLASALWIDGSITQFIQRYRIGIDAAALMGGGHKLSLFLRLGELKLEPATRNALASGIVGLLVLLGLAGRATLKWQYIAASASVLLALGSLGIMSGHAKNLMPIEYHKGLLPTIVPLAALLAFLLLGPRHWIACGRSRLALAGFLALLPYVYVFGTANNYWWQASQAAFFWVLAGAVLTTTRPTSEHLLASETQARHAPVLPALVVALASQLLITVIVQTGIEVPYGQPSSLRDQHRKIRIGEPASTLRVSPGFGNYLEQAIQVSRSAGFSPGTPVVDLTGRSPSTLYAMAASNASQAWMIGGYPGSNALARAYIARASCEELGRAWILIQPGGITSLSPTLLSTFGADLNHDYERAGTIVMDERFFGYREFWTQQLLKPRRLPEAAREACVAARSGQS